VFLLIRRLLGAAGLGGRFEERDVEIAVLRHRCRCCVARSPGRARPVFRTWGFDAPTDAFFDQREGFASTTRTHCDRSSGILSDFTRQVPMGRAVVRQKITRRAHSVARAENGSR
jgi:hypothetical protein